MNLFKRLMCSVSAVAVSAFLVIPVMAANEAQWKRNDIGGTSGNRKNSFGKGGGR